MKRNILFTLSVASIALASCNSGNSYTIKGTVDKSSDGDKVYLLNYTENGLDTISTATISAQKFEMKGEAAQPAAYFLVYENDENEYYTELFTEPGKIEVTLSEESSAKGTPSNNALNDLKAKFKTLNEEISKVYNDISSCTDTTLMKELQAEMKKKTEEYDSTIKNFVNENIMCGDAGLYGFHQPSAHTLPCRSSIRLCSSRPRRSARSIKSRIPFE